MKKYKYSVIDRNDNIIVQGCRLSDVRDEAIRHRGYIISYRQQDGQKIYHNPNGDCAPVGKAW